MNLAESIKRNNLSYIPLESIATMINHGCNASLTGSDIYQYLTEVLGLTYITDTQGVVTHLGYIFETLIDLTADDIDICYCFGVDYDDEDRQGIIDSISRIHLKLSDDDKWMTVIISENGD